MARYDLSEAEWRIVEPLLPPAGRGKERVDDRQVVNGIFYVLRTGSPWRYLPERYGPYTTVYNRFNRWAKKGVWLGMFEVLAARSPHSLHLIARRSCAPTCMPLAVKGGPDHAIGRSRGGLSTKIHAVVDQDGLAVRLLITPGQSSDKTAVPDLLAGLPGICTLVADRGYDSRAILDLVAAGGGQAHIPTQSRVKLQRSVEPTLYRKRNLIERFFCKLKQFRRVATRFDKLARNFLPTLALTASRLWLRPIESTP